MRRVVLEACVAVCLSLGCEAPRARPPRWDSGTREQRETNVINNMLGAMVDAVNEHRSRFDGGRAAMPAEVLPFSAALDRLAAVDVVTPSTIATRAERTRIAVDQVFPAYCSLSARPGFRASRPPPLRCDEFPLRGPWWERYERNWDRPRMRQ
jgi:hypothetical protein